MDGEMDMNGDHDTQILANLNILKENMVDNPKYQLKYIPAQDANGKPKDTFFTSLPQTQDEIDGLSIDSADYQIKELV